MTDAEPRSLPEARTGPLARWWFDVPVRWKGVLVLSLPALALVPTMVVAVVLAQRQPGLRAEARETSQEISQSSGLLAALVDAETGVRGFAATGDDQFRQPFLDAVGSVPGYVADLPDGVADPFVPLVADLTSSAQGVLDLLTDLDAELVAGELDPVVLAGRLAAAKVAMDDLRRDTAALQSTLTTTLEAQRADLDRVEDRLLWTLGAGLVVGGALGLAGMLLLTTGVASRLETLSRNTRRFVEGRPLLAVVRSDDEIGQLTTAIEEGSIALERSARALTEARDDALAATRAKDEFLSRMSHELRTPLTAILGFGQLLQMEDLSDEDRESVDDIVKAGRHLLALINDVLDVSRIETGNLSMSLEPVAVHEVVDDVLSLLRPLAAERDIDLRDDAGLDVVAVADGQRLKQVLLNLVSNAIKYNRRGGSVTVGARDVGEDRVQVAVSDTGPGISDEDQGRLFAPFERLGAAHGEVDGTGIGLALSKGLAEAMGGSLGVESRVGDGSTFWVELARSAPAGDHLAAAAAPGPGAAPAHTAAAAGPGATTVLYVEDNLANLRLMERIFRGRPEHLEGVGQGRLGVELAHQLRPRLVLLDLHLPDLSGEEVLQALRADPATAAIPVAVLSADATPGRVERLLAQGADAYLRKPIDLVELTALLDGLQDG